MIEEKLLREIRERANEPGYADGSKLIMLLNEIDRLREADNARS